MNASRWLAILAVPLVASSAARADESEWFVPLGLPPVASPKRISGGESFPPLPLPATPLRRSERKRQPSPPKLIGKVVWGETASFQYENGIKTTIADWNLCPADSQQLLSKANGTLGLPYGVEPVSLATFEGDPEKMPVLFLSGTRTVRVDPKQAEILRGYALRGGMVLCDSVAGSPYFTDSARKTFERILPEYSFRVVPADHPVYHMMFDVDKVSYPRNLDSDRPLLEAMYIGSRIAVLLSPYGLGCGWDNHEVPFLKKAVYYDVESANRIGMNIVAYAIGYAAAGREEAKPELFGSLDEKPPTDEFVFAQIRHEGAWDVHPGAAAALLRRLRQGTALKASLKRVALRPGQDDLTPYSFLFLSGLDDFRLDDAGVRALRGFLANAGTLAISNGLGLDTFDHAVRRELRRLLPDARLEPVPPTHPIFAAAVPVRDVRYTPAVTGEFAASRAPRLEGISIQGDLRVIYSPYDIEGGWLGCEYPLARGVESESAVPLGMNIVMYAMTH